MVQQHLFYNPVTQKSAKLNYFDKLLINNLSITRSNLFSVKFTSWKCLVGRIAGSSDVNLIINLGRHAAKSSVKYNLGSDVDEVG
jgi:hypothetical protein